jgi:hypothetical protein
MAKSGNGTPWRGLFANVLLVLLALLVVFLAYSFLRQVFLPPVDARTAGGERQGVIQVDVLNGCGVAGVATGFTSYLRARGFDVVEMRNYKKFDVPESLIIDRTGVAGHAERVAYALGIKKENIVRQINEDYFVDVTVVIGRDHGSLKPSP